MKKPQLYPPSQVVLPKRSVVDAFVAAVSKGRPLLLHPENAHAIVAALQRTNADQEATIRGLQQSLKIKTQEINDVRQHYQQELIRWRQQDTKGKRKPTLL